MTGIAFQGKTEKMLDITFLKVNLALEETTIYINLAILLSAT